MKNKAVAEEPCDDRKFVLLGFEFRLLKGVFSPIDFPSTEIFTNQVAKVIPKGSRVLEMGCGAGVTAVVLAKELRCQVTGIDINPIAVRNARENISSCKCGDRVSVMSGDMFDPLGIEEKFEYIIWNSNFMFKEPGARYHDWIDYAFFDVGYEMHKRFFEEGPSFLSIGGRQLLGFSTLGDWTRIVALAANTGCSLKHLDSSPFREGNHSGEYYLLECANIK